MALLQPRLTRDGSFSLYSCRFGEGFHSLGGALGEARSKFVLPASLHRFASGRELRVVEVCVGTGTNTAALLEACGVRELGLDWWGLELDPEPWQLARSSEAFRSQWSDAVLQELALLLEGPRLLWGDGRRRLADLPATLQGRCDLVLLDAFSPQRCPQLWTLEFLGSLAALLAPEGRLLTYCSAAAVRRALQRCGMELATIQAESAATGWSQGTAASPRPLPEEASLRPLGPMELEHLRCRAAEPYRDPEGNASAADIHAARERAQASSGAESSGAWRRRWGVAGCR